MKLKIFIASLVAVVFGFNGIACARPGSYYPPERLNCQLKNNARFQCEPIDRHYLVEDMTNANLQKNRTEVFHFVSAVAYFTANHLEASVFYTYENTSMKMVKLRTIDPSIRPDITHGTWKKFNNDIYTCDAGYLSCPISSLPDIT